MYLRLFLFSGICPPRAKAGFQAPQYCLMELSAVQYVFGRWEPYLFLGESQYFEHTDAKKDD